MYEWLGYLHIKVDVAMELKEGGRRRKLLLHAVSSTPRVILFGCGLFSSEWKHLGKDWVMLRSGKLMPWEGSRHGKITTASTCLLGSRCTTSDILKKCENLLCCAIGAALLKSKHVIVCSVLNPSIYYSISSDQHSDRLANRHGQRCYWRLA